MIGDCTFFRIKVLKNFLLLTMQKETFNFSLFSITGWGIDLDYCDIEWFALEMSRDHSVVFEIASKYCILDSLLSTGALSFLLRDYSPQ